MRLTSGSRVRQDALVAPSQHTWCAARRHGGTDRRILCMRRVRSKRIAGVKTINGMYQC